MTLRSRRKIARAIRKIVKAEQRHPWSRVELQQSLRHLAAHAQRMQLQPEDVLTPNGRDAFTTLARAIARDPAVFSVVGAEWQMVLALAEPEFSIEEQEIFAS